MAGFFFFEVGGEGSRVDEGNTALVFIFGESIALTQFYV